MSSVHDSGEEFVAPDLDMQDLQGFLITLQAQGWPLGLLVKQAIISVRSLHAATHRWQKLEYGYAATAPLWLDQRERDKLVAMLAGQKSVEARAIRQALQEMFPVSAEVVFWEDAPEKTRIITGRCQRCEKTDIFIFDPHWRGSIISPTGLMHVGVEDGMTACGIDAKGPEWWWPS